MTSNIYAPTTDRLVSEFGHRHSVPVITTVIRQSRHDLDCAPLPAMPELLERSARQRLTVLPPTASPYLRAAG